MNHLTRIHRLSALAAICLSLAACGGASSTDSETLPVDTGADAGAGAEADESSFDDPNQAPTEQAEALADTTPPALTVMAPSTTSHTTSHPAINVAGSAVDNRKVSRVTWYNATRKVGGIASQSAYSTIITWSAKSLYLNEGPNTIYLRAYDAAGNSSTKVITVTR